MTEKFEAELSAEDAVSWSGRLDAQEVREWDLRIRMVALDQAVAVLPTLSSAADSEDTKFRTLRRAAAEFEKILKGES